MQTAEGKLRLFVAIDRTSKFAFVELHREAGKMIAAHLHDFINAYNYGRRLKTLRGSPSTNTSANAGQTNLNASA